MAGDGTVVARVSAQQPGHEWAKAGVMIKDGTASGAPYAAIMATPEHGVRLQAIFDTDVAGSATGAPRWLKLTRTGATVTGYESSDGTAWSRVGAVDVDALPPTAEVGLFVASPAAQRVTKIAGGTEVDGAPTVGTATFDDVSVQTAGQQPPAQQPPAQQPPAQQPPTQWSHQSVASGGLGGKAGGQGDGDFVEAGGTFTVTGSGDVAGYGIESFQGAGNDDIVVNSLAGVQIGLMAIIALGVLFAASEYKTGVVRTTFAAVPRRGRVLAAKAVVLGAAVFLAGLAASTGAFFLAQPGMRRNGYEPPAYPHPSLSDGPVLRAVVGTALFLAVLAVFSLGVGTILRRSARAITLVVALVVVPQVVASAVTSFEVAKWINRLTPVAGLAIQHTTERFGTAISPWAGFGVLCAYTVVALAVGWLLLRRRDA
jgi:hypothetical protein